MACSFLPVSSCCPSIQPMDSSNTVRYMINGLPSTGGINIGGSNRYSLILSNAFWQIFSPYNPLIFAEKLENWPTSSSHLRDKSGDIVQSSEKSSYLFFSLWCRHLLNSSDFVGIHFNSSLADNETQEFSRSNPKSTFVRIQAKLIFSQSLKQLQKVFNMFFFCAGLGYHVVHINFNFFMHHVMKESSHCPLVSCACIF